MFDIGWSEMLIIGVVALVVIGPKELPGALKTFAYWMKQARKLAREFQSGVDEMIRQAEEFIGYFGHYPNLNIKVPVGWNELAVVAEVEIGRASCRERV